MVGHHVWMRIVVASRNPVKLRAVEAAFSNTFSGEPLEINSADVASDVSDQPMSDEETRSGARNRARNARLAVPDARFWVGLEGGIQLIDEQLIAFAWMAVLGLGQRIGEARTVTLPLPQAVKALIDEGHELGEANDRVFSTFNSKQKGGAFGLLTNGLYTRESVYTEAVTVALIPFVHESFA